MRFVFIIVSVLSIAATEPHARAYEVDNFTARETLTQDSLDILDAEVNRILERAVRQSNKESPDYCSRALLRQEIVRWTGPDPISILEFWSTITDKVQRTGVDMKSSIYSGARLSESLAMFFAGIGRSFKLNGHVVGTDKLGHFFMQGLEYFKRVHINGEDLNKVLKTAHAEDGIFGMTMTGVKSYADMAANYQGYLFWSQLYRGANPYVRCENGRKWVKQRNFTWADYVNDAWDEAINCSELRPTLAARVKENLEKRGLQCPVEPERCTKLRRLEKAEFFLSPRCTKRS